MVEDVLNYVTSSLSLQITPEKFIELAFPLALYSIGIVLYIVVVSFFCNKLSKRDLFKIDFSKYRGDKYELLEKVVASLSYILEYLILFPIGIFVWFLILSGFLFMLSESLAVETILLVSAAIVATTRIMTYISEDVAQDIAKLIPYVMLGIFLINPNFFNTGLLFERIQQLPNLAEKAAVFLLFIIFIEFTMHITVSIHKLLLNSQRQIPVKKRNGAGTEISNRRQKPRVF